MNKLNRIELDTLEKYGFIDRPSVGIDRASGMYHIMESRLAHFRDSTESGLTENEKRFWIGSFNLFNTDKQWPNPVKLIAGLGSGKSTALESFHIYHGLYNPHNLFGSVVVKPNIEACNEFVKNVNRESERTIAYAVFGKSHYIEQNKKQSDEWEQASRYPVIVITQAMLSSFVQRGRMMELTVWKDVNGVSRRRTALFIDERPEFTSSFTMTGADIERLNSKVQGLANSDRDSEAVFYEEFEKETHRLIRELRKPNQLRSRKLQKGFLRYRVSEHLQNMWDRTQSGTSDYQLLEQFIHITNNGGIVEVGPYGATITSGFNIWKEIGWFNTVVLDATGKGDPNYPDNLISIDGEMGIGFVDFEMDDTDNHNSLTIRFSQKHNFGKSFLTQGNNEELRYRKIVDLVNYVSKEHRSLFVIGHEHLIARLSNDDNVLPSIRFANWSQGKGTNEYADSEAILVLGNILKSGSHYFINTELRNPDQIIEPGISYESGYKMTDEQVQKFYEEDRIVELNQTIGRIRSRKSQSKKFAYIFTMDIEIINGVIDHFSGCTSEEWKLPFSLTSELTKLTAKDNFINWLEEFSKSDQNKVKAKDIREDVLEISTPQWTRVKKDEDVLEAMNRLNVTFKGQSIIKQ